MPGPGSQCCHEWSIIRKEEAGIQGDVMKRFLLLAALVTLAVPVAYAAASSKDKPKKSEARSQSSDSNAAKSCKAERATLGVADFNKKYGTNHNLKNAFGKCVSGKSRGQKGAKDDEQEWQNEAKDDEQQGQSEAKDDD